MRASVAAAFPKFVVQFEGRCSWMYLDTKELVTTGVGNLIDPVSAALPLPWRSKGGYRADEKAIRTEWSKTKARRDLAPRGGFAFESLAVLHLADGDIDDLVDEKARQFAGVLWGNFLEFEDWPADAQLAVMDMGWNYGPNFTDKKLPDGSYMWKNFRRTLPTQDWLGAAKHCISGNNPKTRRNVARVRLFTNAAKVAELGLDRGRLWNTETPKPGDNDMPLTDVDVAKIRAALQPDLAKIKADVIAELFTEANRKRLAVAVWQTDNVIPSGDPKDQFHKAQTFLQFIWKAVKKP